MPGDMADLQKQMGRRIKWARELVASNIAEFSRLLGVHRTTIVKIEDGSRAPSISLVLDISRRLRVTPDYILIGSLYGVDEELAYRLLRRHPELNRPPPQHIFGNSARADDFRRSNKLSDHPGRRLDL